MRRTLVVAATSLSILLCTSLTIGATPPGRTTDGGPPDFDGTWAQKLVTTAISEVDVVGEVTSQTTTYQRVRIDQDADELRLETTACDVSFDSDKSSLNTRIPAAFVESLPTSRRRAAIKHRDNGYYLLAPRKPHVFGMRLDDADTALPTKPSDPRVVDQDGDGHPGMTVGVSGMVDGQLYFVQRSFDRLWGRLVAADKIAGRVKWSSQRVVLDATTDLLKKSPKTKPHPDPKQSYFRMARVDDDATCTKIMDQRDQLF